MAPIVTKAASAAAPIDSSLHSGSLLGLIILILNLIVVVEVLNSERSVSSKFLWCMLIFLCPIVGIVLYFIHRLLRA
ncbi:hypothetical protein BG011_009283 [Mortierella polycephala]|uniref:Cardiolipin synthase N-terminal domain-containing protein n=1 Tax=Mortierella polycephala TaxID=41804 RepID=A0A9P6TWB2_9FUNG|nr:hypothetical protein BG011_009283 [Mortierella polycephala]